MCIFITHTYLYIIYMTEGVRMGPHLSVGRAARVSVALDSEGGGQQATRPTCRALQLLHTTSEEKESEGRHRRRSGKEDKPRGK
jgi:hypothetical protein